MAPRKQGKKNCKKGKTLKKKSNVHEETKAMRLMKTLLMRLYEQNLWSQFSNCCNWIRGKCPILSGTENTNNAPNPTLTLEDGSTCSICLGSFHEPVIINCGHSFCRACITEHWKGTNMNPFCPLCRMDCPDQHLIPNRNLEYILENYRELCSSDNDKDYKIIGNKLKRDESKTCWFPAIQKLKSSTVQHMLKKCGENVLLAPVNLYRSAATVYGGLSVVAGENAGGKTKKGN